MTAPRFHSSCRALGLCLALAVGLSAVDAGRAHAQATGMEMPIGSPVDADLKGMVGLGLFGAELGFVIPAVAGARDAWVYIVFPIVGAGAGAAGGYFLLEKGDGHPELAVAVLTTSMALVVPAMVLTLAATAYDPESSDPGTPEDLKVGGKVELSRWDRQQRAARAAGPGLLRVSEEALYLGAPAVSTQLTIDAREALRTGVAQAREVSVSVVSGRF